MNKNIALSLMMGFHYLFCGYFCLWVCMSVCVCCWEFQDEKKCNERKAQKEKRIEDKHNDPWNQNFLNIKFKIS